MTFESVQNEMSDDSQSGVISNVPVKKKVGSSASSGLSASGALNVWTMFNYGYLSVNESLTSKSPYAAVNVVSRCSEKNRGRAKTHSKGMCNSKRSRSFRPRRHIHSTDRQSCSSDQKDRVSTYPSSCGALLGAKGVSPLHDARCTELQPHRGIL